MITLKKALKAELMIFGINNDFFGYGSTCTKRSDNKYIVIVDGERGVYTATELAGQFDVIDEDDKKNIIDTYYEKELMRPSL